MLREAKAIADRVERVSKAMPFDVHDRIDYEMAWGDVDPDRAYDSGSGEKREALPLLP